MIMTKAMNTATPPEYRQFSTTDRLLTRLDLALAVTSGQRPVPRETGCTPRPYPPAVHGIAGEQMSEAEVRHAAGLMRVNHAGEICAQALYSGQALTARHASVQQAMQRAAGEELDHLDWCAERLAELDSGPSKLAPVWYAGSFAIGLFAGALGDRWNLGFLAATERQVEAHLDDHLGRLPAADQASRAIVEQMKHDEAGHAAMAERAGAAALPEPVTRLMALTAGVMKFLAYRL